MVVEHRISTGAFINFTVFQVLKEFIVLTNNDLIVLGFLLERPMHGYEINLALKEEDVEIWFEISTAAIYYSLNKLRRLSMIAEVHSRASHSDKTIYHVTDYGRGHFFSGMESLLTSEKPIHAGYDLGIFMLNRLPQDRASMLLKKRIDFLNQLKLRLESKHEEAQGHLLKQSIIMHAKSVAQVDIDWLVNIRQQLHDADSCGSDFQSLMTLQGDLQDFHLPDLIKLIDMGKHSGTLVISSGPLSRSITFDKGRPHCAASLVNNKVVEDTNQVLDNVYQLFLWQEGDFIFDQRGCPQNGCFLLNVPSDHLILEGVRRLNSWETIQRIVASSLTVFERSNLQVGYNDLILSESELRILTLIDGFSDVTSLARSSGFTEFETSKILYGLYAVGFVQLADPDKNKLHRVFREFAELTCRSALPVRTAPEDALECEQEVNKRCEHLPVSIRNGIIEDQTSPSMQTDALADVYREFLQTQQTVLSIRLGRDIVKDLHQQVLGKISPDLREMIEKYALI